MSVRTLSCILLFLALVMPRNVFPAYIEGIDTTDVDGYGLDSAFCIIGGIITGQKLVPYTDQWSRHGIFRYSFEEIHIAVDSLSLPSAIYQNVSFDHQQNNYCFVVCHDSCYYKVHVIDRFSDTANNYSTRYVYKYGINTTPLNRTMMPSNYDRTARYKPNNLVYLYDVNAGKYGNKFLWEPPLPNDNHLSGYILYFHKTGVSIDTSAPINLAQWDSVAFTDSTHIALPTTHGGSYYNIVAVYAEGKTDFLKGWSHLFRPSEVTNEFLKGRALNALSINYTQSGALISSNHREGLLILTIVDCTGRQLARVSNLRGNRFYWNPLQQGISPGLYLLRAEFPDRSVVTQPFVVAR